MSNAKSYQSLNHDEEKVVGEHKEHEWGTKRNLTNTTYFLIILQFAMLIMFGAFGGSELVQYGTGTQAYNMLIGVEIMMFIGFGYLMTFMKWYGLGAVGFTMLITAVGFQWYLFCGSFWTQWWNDANNAAWTPVPVNLYSMVDAMFGVATVLISFGALIGKVSPLQLMVLTVIELFLHACDAKALLDGYMKLQDMGGTYAEHMFGAYFGLAVAFVLGVPKSAPAMGTVPDIFSLIGTLFLWIYWPSFVSGAAVPDSRQQQQAIVNTILALSASTIITFVWSSLLGKDGRFRPVDIQNATLAGGVSIGASANLDLGPLAAVVIGLVAGSVSCFGFNVIQPWLEKTWGLHDSCGIHNLHAMPSVIGAVASVFVVYYENSNGRHIGADIYGDNGASQWWRQALSIVYCMGFAIAAGIATGHILKALAETEEEKSHFSEFKDEAYWETAEDFGKTVESEIELHTRA